MKGCVINGVTAAGEKNREESVNENNEALKRRQEKVRE